MRTSIGPNGLYPDPPTPSRPSYVAIWRAVLIAMLLVSMLAILFPEAI